MASAQWPPPVQPGSWCQPVRRLVRSGAQPFDIAASSCTCTHASPSDEPLRYSEPSWPPWPLVPTTPWRHLPHRTMRTSSTCHRLPASPATDRPSSSPPRKPRGLVRGPDQAARCGGVGVDAVEHESIFSATLAVGDGAFTTVVECPNVFDPTCHAMGCRVRDVHRPSRSMRTSRLAGRRSPRRSRMPARQLLRFGEQRGSHGEDLELGCSSCSAARAVCRVRPTATSARGGRWLRQPANPSRASSRALACALRADRDRSRSRANRPRRSRFSQVPGRVPGMPLSWVVGIRPRRPSRARLLPIRPRRRSPRSPARPKPFAALLRIRAQVR